MKRMASRTWVAAAALAGTAAGQQLEWQLVGDQRGERFGDDLVRLADRNGDGIPELAVSATQAGAIGASGRIRILSGSDLSLIVEIGADLSPWLGRSVASAGDHDGDGVEDLLAGDPFLDNAVVLLSGADGRVLATYPIPSPLPGEFGARLAPLGDLDGDGKVDFAVTGPREAATNGNQGVVHILSSATGQELWRFESSTFLGGAVLRDRNIAAVGDWNGDGATDLALVDVVAGSSSSYHVVRVRSGADGAAIADFPFDQGDDADEAITSVADAADFDGDGTRDLAIGSVQVGFAGSARGVVLSGANGARLLLVDGGSPSTFARFEPMADHDSDGLPEFALACNGGGAVNAPHPGLHLCRGSDGTLLHEIAAPVSANAWGSALAELADLDGDLLPEIVSSDPDRIGPIGWPAGVVETWSWSGAAPIATRLGTNSNQPVSFYAGRIGDVDLDGRLDWAQFVDGPDPSFHALEVRSGRDGSLLAVHPAQNGADQFAAITDLDGDGVVDYHAMVGPDLELRSGVDGALLQRLSPPAGESYLGNALAHVESSGALRIAIGDPFHDSPKSDAGRLDLWDVASNTRLWRLQGNSKGESLGSSVAALGDVTGDGVGDFAAGAPYSNSAGADAGRVVVVNGATGSVRKVLLGPSQNDNFGMALAAIDDVDGDGFGELLVGVPGSLVDTGEVQLLSTATWAPIWTATGGGQKDFFGKYLAAVGDLNGDGISEWATAGELTPRIEVHSGANGTLVAVWDESTLPLYLLSSPLRPSAPWLRNAAGGTPRPDLLLMSYHDYEGIATLLAFDELSLQVTPSLAPLGAAVSADTRGGRPSFPTALELVSYGGSPVGTFIEISALDTMGAHSIGGIVPPGLAGITMELRAWAIGFDGRLASSSVQALTFE